MVKIMKKIFKIFTLTILFVFLITTTALAGSGDNGKSDDKGFDDCGYNYQANIYVGSADCVDRTEDGTVWGDPTYANDHLVMKWSKGWDDARFGGEEWGHDAWLNNQWNGKAPGGSGETWHNEVDYSQVCADGNEPTDGGKCIWGIFEETMSHGTIDNEHVWVDHATPAGSGTEH